MFDVIGFIVCLIACVYATGFVFFATVPTLGEALFSGKWYEKLLGVAMWVLLLYGWYFLLSMVSINLGIKV